MGAWWQAVPVHVSCYMEHRTLKACFILRSICGPTDIALAGGAISVETVRNASVVDCVFERNEAKHGAGGAIFMGGLHDVHAPPRCTVL